MNTKYNLIKKNSIILIILCGLTISCYGESSDTALKTDRPEQDIPTTKALLNLHAQTIRDLFLAESNQLSHKAHPNLQPNDNPLDSNLQSDNNQDNNPETPDPQIDVVFQVDNLKKDLLTAILQSQQLTSERILTAQDKLLVSQEIAAKALIATKIIDNAPICTLCVCIFVTVGALVKKYG